MPTSEEINKDATWSPGRVTVAKVAGRLALERELATAGRKVKAARANLAGIRAEETRLQNRKAVALRAEQDALAKRTKAINKALRPDDKDVDPMSVDEIAEAAQMNRTKVYDYIDRDGTSG